MSTLPDYADALTRALGTAAPLDRDETVPLEDAGGRVLREPLVADRDLPPFPRAQMDGYAVRAADVGRAETFPVVGDVAAGQPGDVNVPPGACVSIATGAPVPGDVDTVIQHEHSDRANPVRFTIDRIAPGHAVHPRGADARAGTELVPAGTVLHAMHLGLAATVGAARVRVAERPRAIVLTSGDEVRGVGAAPAPHEIRNSNAPQTAELLRRCGAAPIAHRHVADEQDATRKAVGAGLAEADLVITVGGISAGVRDHFPDAFDTHGVKRTVHGAAIQPGRPVIVGRTASGVVVVGLPGNPVSSLVCSCLFAWPIVRVMVGLDPALPWRPVTLDAPVRPNPRRRVFRPARLLGADRAIVPAWAGSGDLVHTALTDGVVELPVQETAVEAGTTVRFLPWP